MSAPAPLALDAPASRAMLSCSVAQHAWMHHPAHLPYPANVETFEQESARIAQEAGVRALEKAAKRAQRLARRA